MDALQKLQLLGRATRYEPAEDVGLTGGRWPTPRVPEALVECISYAVTPQGRIPLLKTLLSSACERDCYYCPFRVGRDFRRATFTPDDLAKLFLQLYQNDLVEGLFISSGLVGGGPDTQNRILATAEILRKRYHFRGYIHLKIMPGAERDQVAAGMALADRVSVNLEAPNDTRLAQLAPHKIFTEELLQRLQWVEELRQSRGGRGPSMTTQFVVGAAGESDLELLHTTAYLHRQLRLARAYFSGFRPIADTPLEDVPPASAKREQRLYQASFLLRDYGFDLEELSFTQDGNLPLQEDPKLVWAREHLVEAPVEINRADRETLLRVPGIGIKSADRILAARRQGTLRDLGQLRRLHVPAQRAAPFILLDGKRPAHQLPLPFERERARSL
ncbi:MAG: radical SAM protein [Anaerolineae bacterium]